MSEKSLPPALMEKLNLACRNWAGELPARLRKIQEIWTGLQPDSWQKERFDTLHRMVHSLAGSGATFGFPRVGEKARVMENLIATWCLRGEVPDQTGRNAVSQALQHLVEQIALDLRTGPAPIMVEEAEESQKTPPREAALILLAEPDALWSKTLGQQLACYGYRVETCTTLDILLRRLEVVSPGVVILNVAMPDGDGALYWRRFREERENLPPVIFITRQGDLETRLNVVRAGGVTLFEKPVDITRLVDTLDELVHPLHEEPYRILVVDDSRALAQHLANILEEGGMQTKVVNNPLDVLEHLHEFRPDLALMDLYMPQCTGLELARVIRQQPVFVGMPIVFLSGEKNLDKQLSAMATGGDDFLTKPIQPDHLVRSVLTRVRRSRILQGFMIKDSLTGLYNHTRTKEQLALAVGRAQRLGKPLAMAMVDIDKFKSVNDTYGHPTGDRVIRSLSRLLRQRVRSTDIVGRYGGEEFAVIFPETDGETALGVMDTLREAFSTIQHQFEETVFTRTFSCGVAAFPGQQTATALNDAADRALYEAKNGGRNRVVLAGK
ncbi:MAG: diguanylate cyclase [Magnetococcales bacterium]|nr:diguanylate cyclase [Magnetococcales bacterium]MBF0154569.1 diguanylate cyclase [Magnetococcales bacterium]MBF0308008.1 diguanylate cyclase [Magnetococcales bacterium]